MIMNRETVKRLAIQCGFEHNVGEEYDFHSCDEAQLEAFALAIIEVWCKLARPRM
jgi:hypothetical protein